MNEALNLARPPTGLLSHTAVGLLRQDSGFSRSGTPLAGTAVVRLSESCPAATFSGTKRAGGEEAHTWLRGHLTSPQRHFCRTGTFHSISGSNDQHSTSRTVVPNAAHDAFRNSMQAAHAKRGEETTRALSSGNSFVSPRRAEGMPSSDSFGSPHTGLELPAIGGESIETLAEEFNRGMKAIDHQLDDISRSMRSDHLSPNLRQEALEREQREAERRRREAEMRKARKREQAARNPHKKVALRLENTRRFDHEAEQNKGIPIQRIDVVGAKGSETVELVDVTVLKSRCMDLREGANLQSLLELQRTRDRKARLISTGKSSLAALQGCSSSMPELGTSTAIPTHKGQSYEARRGKAVLQKDAAHMGKITRRLSSMRAEWPHALPYNLEEAVNQKVLQMPRERWSEHVEVTRQTSANLSPPRARLKSIVKDGPLRQKCRVRSQDELCVRSRRNWALVFALMRWLVLLFQVHNRNQAMETVRATISQCGEWSRIRLVIHQLKMTILTLQAWAREFLALKNKRLETMQTQWQKVEDMHLERFCISYANTALNERYGKEEHGSRHHLLTAADEAKSKQRQQVHESLKEGLYKLNWKQFRIPAQERRAVLSRYYMVRLKKRARVQTSIVAVMQKVVQSQREMDGFLRQFGAEVTKDNAVTSDKNFRFADLVSRPFWHLSEEIILQLIALSAKKLKDLKPYQFHPSLRDLPGNVMYRSCLKEAGMLLAPVGSGRITMRPRSRPAVNSQPVTTKAAWARKSQCKDIDDVFGLLTPRLREITEKQSNEYRMDNPVRLATPLAVVA
mmetsp:Transcript_102868/g.286477  ORF Transcript_102868/g.286477 Transcript_102868/m.286477 type:complete len:796 (-) Transcript_102868:566-2953(-)